MNNKQYHFLYPGAFKPFHDGHYKLLTDFINYSKDNGNHADITLIMSTAPRYNITCEHTRYFIEHICDKLGVNVLYSNKPVMECYRIVGLSEQRGHDNEVYAIISSDKGNDYERRLDFYKAYQPEGKYYKGIQKTFEYYLSPVPLYIDYDTPLSSTLLRRYISEDNDYHKFKLGYRLLLRDRIIDESLLRDYFERLHNDLKI